MIRFAASLFLASGCTFAAAQEPSPLAVAAAVPPAQETTGAADAGLPPVANDPSGGNPVRMTLEACMAYAVEHSPLVRQQQAVNRNYRQDYIASVAALMPSLRGSVYANTSFGRSVDADTNTYTDTSNLSNDYQVSGEIPLFAGLAGINTIRAAGIVRMMGGEQLQQRRDEAALLTMQAYFDVVYYTESVHLAREQLATSAASLARSRKLFELGLKSAADVAEVESQHASDDYLLTRQENELCLARIALAEAMHFPSDRPLEIETDIAIATPLGAPSFDEVLSYALDHDPRARNAAFEVRRKRLQLAVAKGGLYPSLYVGGGYSTNFFMDLDHTAASASFAGQLRDKRGYYFAARLDIPIFGGLARRTRVGRARNDWRIAREQREQTLRALQSEVARNYYQMVGAGKEFVQASKKSAAAELAYRAVAGKYERGIVSALDLRTSADNLLRARSERLRARLQYIIHTRMVEYFNGMPLIR